jgi:hypothetical protein
MEAIGERENELKSIFPLRLYCHGNSSKIVPDSDKTC